jgi:hypothetical protein
LLVQSNILKEKQDMVESMVVSFGLKFEWEKC